MLAVTALGIALSKDLLAVVMFFSIYGLLSANFFVSMDAVDVAFTEAAVGAGISPLLMLATLAVVGRYEHTPRVRAPVALALVLVTGALLIVGTLDMPAFGSAEAPAHNHVAPRYINASGEEIGIPNIVTSILASYRAYDTLGEVVVIFAAGVGVLSLLLARTGDKTLQLADHLASARHHKILRIVSKMLIAPILLFALYVQFHGDYGPGGGFQAGVIFAAAIILYTMFFGLKVARRVIDQTLIRILAALGVLIFGTVGVLSLFSGKPFLDYSALAQDPVSGQHIGILLIELGVGITVASVMVLIFFAFAGHIDRQENKPS